MFENANNKLQDARMAIKRLIGLISPPLKTNIQIKSGPSGVCGDSVGIDDPVVFSEAFSSCVTQVRSVGDAVLKDEAANKLPGFKDWRKAKKDELENDDLMEFINQRRIDDFHFGQRYLEFTMNYGFPSGGVGVVPFKGAVLHINGTGLYWINPDIPDERHPYQVQKGFVFTVAIINPPTMHRGKPLSSSDPVTVCAMGEKYYTELLREARRLFK